MLAQGYNFIIIIAHDARYKHRTNVTVVSINQLIATYDLVQFWPSLLRNAMLWGECNVVLQREGQNLTAITCILWRYYIFQLRLATEETSHTQVQKLLKYNPDTKIWWYLMT